MLCVALGQIIWGFSYLFIKVAQQYASTTILLSMRFSIAFFLMSIPLCLKKVSFSFKNKGKAFLPFIIFGIAHPFYYYCEGNGVLFTNSAFAGVLLAISPLFSIVLARICLHEKTSIKQLLYCILPIGGVICITLAGQKIGNITSIGVVYLLCTCFLQAVVSTANKSASIKASSFERTYILLLCCSVSYMFLALHSIEYDLRVYFSYLLNIEYVLAVIGLAVLCSVVALLAVNYGAKYLSVMQVSIFTSLTSVVSLLSGVFILHESISVLSIMGSLLIVFGIYKVNTTK